MDMSDGSHLSFSLLLVVSVIVVSEERYPLLLGCWMDSFIKLALAGKRLSIGAGVGQEILIMVGDTHRLACYMPVVGFIMREGELMYQYQSIHGTVSVFRFDSKRVAVNDGTGQGGKTRLYQGRQGA